MHARRLKVQLTKPGGCPDRIVTLVVQVTDAYGAMSICGGTSCPKDVHACPTAKVLPFPGTPEKLIAELEDATSSFARNLLSGSELLAKTIAVKTAIGDKCQVPMSLGITAQSCVIAVSRCHTYICSVCSCDQCRTARLMAPLLSLTTNASAMKYVGPADCATSVWAGDRGVSGVAATSCAVPGCRRDRFFIRIRRTIGRSSAHPHTHVHTCVIAFVLGLR